jgi:hypothetical protein
LSARRNLLYETIFRRGPGKGGLDDWAKSPLQCAFGQYRDQS